MTGSKPASLQIVRTYEIMHAPTGEGTRFEASDGSVWHPVRPFEPVAGYLVGDRIVPRVGGE